MSVYDSPCNERKQNQETEFQEMRQSKIRNSTHALLMLESHNFIEKPEDYS